MDKEKKKDIVCNACKVTTSVVTTNDLYWCANCYTHYINKAFNSPRVIRTVHNV